MKQWQANLLGIVAYLLMALVAWLEFSMLDALGFIPMPEPLAAIAVVFLFLQFWLFTKIPPVRRFLALPIIPPEED